MAKNNLTAAAAAQLEEMQQTTAQKMIQQAAAPKAPPQPQKRTAADSEGAKNDTPFTIWTTAENVRKWKAYQKAKKADVKTQAAFVEAALLEYMMAHPVTDDEKAELLRTLEL